MSWLPSKKLQYLNRVSEFAFNPRDFDIEVNVPYPYVQNTKCDKITHAPTQYSFMIRDGRNKVRLSPGKTEVVESISVASESDILRAYDLWLLYLGREVNSLSVLESFRSGMSGMHPNAAVMQKFSKSDKEELVIRIDIVKSKLKEISLTEDQSKAFDDKLAHLVTLVEDMDKFDWKNLFLGTVFDLVVLLTLPPEISGAVYRVILDAWNNYILP